MRYYIGKQALRDMLDDLVKRKDQEALKVFREIVLYRHPVECHPKSVTETDAIYKKVERMLFMPRILILSAFNLVLTAFCLMFLPKTLAYLPWAGDGIWILGILYLFTAFEILRMYHVLKYSEQYYPYLLVDELLNRKIIQLCFKKGKTTLAKTSIQSKKNPKAKVAD